jgi:HemY protein
LRVAREAAGLAPDLVPAVALAGRLLGQRGDLRRASRLIEACWKLAPHPDLANSYLDLRPGDSAADRLARARTLARLAPDDSESHLCIARAAIDARDFATARAAMQPLIDGEARPSARMCLMMADLEETEHGMGGRVREWLARASRAPRDKAWVADGVVSDTWAPVSPVTGKIDAYRWQTPAERLSAVWEPVPHEAEPAVARPALPREALESPPPAVAQAPAQAPGISEEEALAKLAAIRSQAKAAPAEPRAAMPFPLVSAPDDPGPDESLKD